MDIVVNPELQAYIDPLTPEEYEALERSLLAEGCRDALVLWDNILVDGHNRYRLCRKHGLPFQTVQNPRFRSMEDVHLWMIDQHLGRRSVSDFQRGVLALRKREILAQRRQAAVAATETPPTDAADTPAAAPAPAADTVPQPHAPEPMDTREALARAARLSSSQVGMIERIHKQATPEVVAAVKAGTLSISAAAAVSTLPPEEQVAAASAGADELKQAAKRVREAKRKARADKDAAEPAPDTARASAAPAVDAVASDAALVASLRERIAELTAENAALREQLAALQAGTPPF